MSYLPERREIWIIEGMLNYTTIIETPKYIELITCAKSRLCLFFTEYYS